jgi:hypothetical protein
MVIDPVSHVALIRDPREFVGPKYLVMIACMINPLTGYGLLTVKSGFGEHQLDSFNFRRVSMLNTYKVHVGAVFAQFSNLIRGHFVTLEKVKHGRFTGFNNAVSVITDTGTIHMAGGLGNTIWGFHDD